MDFNPNLILTEEQMENEMDRIHNWRYEQFGPPHYVWHPWDPPLRFPSDGSSTTGDNLDLLGSARYRASLPPRPPPRRPRDMPLRHPRNENSTTGGNEVYLVALARYRATLPPRLPPPVPRTASETIQTILRVEERQPVVEDFTPVDASGDSSAVVWQRPVVVQFNPRQQNAEENPRPPVPVASLDENPGIDETVVEQLPVIPFNPRQQNSEENPRPPVPIPIASPEQNPGIDERRKRLMRKRHKDLILHEKQKNPGDEASHKLNNNHLATLDVSCPESKDSPTPELVMKKNSLSPRSMLVKLRNLLITVQAMPKDAESVSRQRSADGEDLVDRDPEEYQLEMKEAPQVGIVISENDAAVKDKPDNTKIVEEIRIEFENEMINPSETKIKSSRSGWKACIPNCFLKCFGKSRNTEDGDHNSSKKSSNIKRSFFKRNNRVSPTQH